MAEFKDGKTSGVKDLGSDTYTSDIALSGDGKVLVYMGPEDDGVSSGQIFRIFDPETLEVLSSTDTITGELLSLSYDGSLIAIGASSRSVYVYKTKGFSKVFSALLVSDEAYLSDMELSPDGRYLAVRQGIDHYDAKTGVTTESDAADVYDINAREKVLSFASGHTGFFSGSLAFSPNSAYFVCSMPDNTILIYDTRTWQLIRKLQDNNNLPWFQFSPDSSLMVTVVSDADKGKGNITIWDTNGFTAVDTDSGSPIFAVAISKDNDTIAVGYDDGIKVFRKSANPYAAAQD